MKLLLDMNLSPDWLNVFSVAGLRAIHWSEVGAADAPDSALFTWAHRNGHVLFTHDLNFSAMLPIASGDSPSVFKVRTQDISPAAAGPRVVSVLRRFEADLAAGALLVMDELRQRIRLLPLS